MDPTMALKAIMLAKGLIDKQLLDRRLQEIESTVDAIGRYLAEDARNDVRVGFNHLAEAVSLGDGAVRNDELTLARGVFARLISRPVPAIVRDGFDTAMTPDEVHAFGHLGNYYYYYFLLRDEPRRALAEAYTCTERFPWLGVQMFPRELFGKDYRPAAEAVTRDGQERDRYQRERRSYRREAPAYYGEWAWKLAKATGAVVGGIAAGAVNPSLASRGAMYAIGQFTAGTEASAPLPSRG
jgi:hypothetical protein